MTTAASTTGTTPRNTQRQPKFWVTNPATTGPISAGSTQAAASQPNTTGWALCGKDRPMTT
jgi:hypothetical protein